MADADPLASGRLFRKTNRFSTPNRRKSRRTTKVKISPTPSLKPLSSSFGTSNPSTSSSFQQLFNTQPLPKSLSVALAALSPSSPERRTSPRARRYGRRLQPLTPISSERCGSESRRKRSSLVSGEDSSRRNRTRSRGGLGSIGSSIRVDLFGEEDACEPRYGIEDHFDAVLRPQGEDTIQEGTGPQHENTTNPNLIDPTDDHKIVPREPPEENVNEEPLQAGRPCVTAKQVSPKQSPVLIHNEHKEDQQDDRESPSDSDSGRHSDGEGAGKNELQTEPDDLIHQDVMGVADDETSIPDDIMKAEEKIEEVPAHDQKSEPLVDDAYEDNPNDERANVEMQEIADSDCPESNRNDQIMHESQDQEKHGAALPTEVQVKDSSSQPSPVDNKDVKQEIHAPKSPNKRGKKSKLPKQKASNMKIQAGTNNQLQSKKSTTPKKRKLSEVLRLQKSLESASWTNAKEVREQSEVIEISDDDVSPRDIQDVHCRRTSKRLSHGSARKVKVEVTPVNRRRSLRHVRNVKQENDVDVQSKMYSEKSLRKKRSGRSNRIYAGGNTVMETQKPKTRRNRDKKKSVHNSSSVLTKSEKTSGDYGYEHQKKTSMSNNGKKGLSPQRSKKRGRSSLSSKTDEDNETVSTAEHSTKRLPILKNVAGRKRGIVLREIPVREVLCLSDEMANASPQAIQGEENSNKRGRRKGIPKRLMYGEDEDILLAERDTDTVYKRRKNFSRVHRNVNPRQGEVQENHSKDYIEIPVESDLGSSDDAELVPMTEIEEGVTTNTGKWKGDAVELFAESWVIECKANRVGYEKLTPQEVGKYLRGGFGLGKDVLEPANAVQETSFQLFQDSVPMRILNTLNDSERTESDVIQEEIARPKKRRNRRT